MGDYFKGYSDSELAACLDKIYRRCLLDFAGGLSYGMDWPTLRAVFPRRAEVLKAGMAEQNMREDVRRKIDAE